MKIPASVLIANINSLKCLFASEINKLIKAEKYGITCIDIKDAVTILSSLIFIIESGCIEKCDFDVPSEYASIIQNITTTSCSTVLSCPVPYFSAEQSFNSEPCNFIITANQL